MSRLNLYKRPVDDEDWAWAQWKADSDRVSLSRVVADAIRAYRIRHEEQLEKDEEER